MPKRPLLHFLFLSFFLAIISVAEVQAANCTASVTNLSFGSVDTLGATATESTAELSIMCDQAAPETSVITVCANLRAGSGGASGGLRKMLAGTNSLSYGIYADGAYSVPWGSFDEPTLGSPRSVAVPVSGGSGTALVYLYGVVPAGQGTVPPDSYASLFSAPDTSFIYAEGDTLNCASPAGGTETTATFSVQANVLANCLLDAGDIDFGTVGLIDSNIDATGNLKVTCTPGTSYEISLDGGLSGAVDPEQRLMQSVVGSVVYGLYTDAARSQPWGQTLGTLVEAAGNGAQQQLTIYGRVPAQVARAGAYSDTVVVVISY